MEATTILTRGDPQLVWRGKDAQDWTDLVVNAPPLYIQEKVHPKVLIDDLLRQSRERREAAEAAASGTADMFGDFNGIPAGADKTDFYAHDQNWTNRMILGDSLQVMASLAEREGLRGKVQCVYFDPPYGITFNSNFQWSTTSREVKDGNRDHISREPEQVKAFRDTWRDGVNSYLTYLRDRLTVARDLLAPSGSVFVQIGDENVHRVRVLLDEVFGEDCFITEILVKKKGSQKGGTLDAVNDYILWYGRSGKETGTVKVRPAFEIRSQTEAEEDFPFAELRDGTRVRASDLSPEQAQDVVARYAANPLKSGGFRRKQSLDFQYQGRTFPIGQGQCWKHTVVEDDASTPGMDRLAKANRLHPQAKDVRFVRYLETPSLREISNWWDGFGGASNQIYVVQTNERVVQRCLLMCTDPGDLVLDITCGSGTTAYVAEQWGRRWITIDTSRVALALARARIMGARYPYYLLADSPEGQAKEAEVTRRPRSSQPTHGNIRQGFVYERVPKVTSAAIANNAEIEVIWETWQKKLEPLREALNAALKKDWQDWQIPRAADAKWSDKAKQLHADWWASRNERQREIDASIAAKAESEYLYDKPYADKKRVRVAGPFTVDSLSPHRTLAMDIDDGLIDGVRQPKAEYEAKADFASVMLENLKAAGVQQAHKADRISFTSIVGWPGEYVCAEGRYMEGDKERRAAIFIGLEFGTVSRPDLVSAAREAADAGFDVLIACAFNYEAHAAEFEKLGRVPVLKARMNPDLHMAGELKNTGAGNLFVVFGEPDIRIEPVVGGSADGKVRVRVKGVDVFRPQTGEIESGGTDSIALWMIDTEYNEESFFVRQAYFLGASAPYKALKTTLKAEIDAEAWATLNSDVSRPFEKPKTGRIAVKVINHLGDEVMKVFGV
jgi:adenine-specific DNA-methyltransferase